MQHGKYDTGMYMYVIVHPLEYYNVITMVNKKTPLKYAPHTTVYMYTIRTCISDKVHDRHTHRVHGSLSEAEGESGHKQEEEKPCS